MTPQEPRPPEFRCPEYAGCTLEHCCYPGEDDCYWMLEREADKVTEALKWLCRERAWHENTEHDCASPHNHARCIALRHAQSLEAEAGRLRQALTAWAAHVKVYADGTATVWPMTEEGIHDFWVATGNLAALAAGAPEEPQQA